jgi:hypothetical protein
MKVFAPGTQVRVGGRDATILAVTIRGNQAVQYDVAWWSDATRNNAWLDACEVEAADDKNGYLTIGFHAAGRSLP